MIQMQTILITKEIFFLENELDELYNSKEKGAQIRSRAKWINDGEKNTNFFSRA